MADVQSSERFYLEWVEQPAQMTREQTHAIERFLLDPSSGDSQWRRVAFASLTRSAKELVAGVNDQTAMDMARAIVRVEEYAGRLKELTQMMETASERMSLSLCNRADMARLLEMARCDSDQLIQ